MLKVCNKKNNSNKFLDFVQRIFCIAKKHANHIHRRITNIPHYRKIHWLSYIHIILLLVVFYLYNITTFQKADDITIPVDETAIVIQNEPQIVPDQPQEEVVMTWEQIEQLPVETLTWETLTWEMLTWEAFISGDEELFSWVLAGLSWESLYNISGDIIGEVQIQSGEITPVDMSGASLITQPLSVIYPEKDIQINLSWYVLLDGLESVMTTWWEAWATYCSRVTYENISSILKAWIWTYRETNDYVLQGDTDQLVNQGLTDYSLLELTWGQIAILFTGSKATVYGSVYDVYITFVVNEIKVYHRIAVIYADDGQRYILDPLRGAKIIAPQKISDYLAYYNDETDVHRYVGQAYSPLEIKKEFTSYKDITQVFQEIPEEPILTIDELTGVLETWTAEVATEEEVIPEPVIETPQISQKTPALGGEAALQSSNDFSAAIDVVTDEEKIVTDYFDRAYDKWSYDEKIIELQNLLTRLQVYEGKLDGVYSEDTITAVYTYQEQNGLLKGEEDNKAVRWYLGPTTRKYLNQSYIEYQHYEISLEQPIELQPIELTANARAKTMQYFADQWYDTGSDTLTPVTSETLIGNQVLDFSNLSGSLLVPVVLQSTNELDWQTAEVQIPEWAMFKTSEWDQFTGEMAPPEFEDSSAVEKNIDKDVLSMIEVGNQDEHIQLEDGSGNDVYATVMMPVSGKNPGDQIDIYSSEDGVNFNYLTRATVQDIQGDSYVVFFTDHFSVIITVATNGTNISADKAGNSTSGAAYTALGNIVIAEWSNGDISASQTSKTLILTAPANWRFRAGSGSVSYTTSMDITAASIVVAASTITVTFSTDGFANRSDTITISNIRVQAITGNVNIWVTGYIYRTAANPWTAAAIPWITNDSTSFWSLLQIAGGAKNMITTLTGQTFVAGSGNNWTALNQTAGVSFALVKLTAVDQFKNIITSYAWSKTISYSGPSSWTYTTGVSFTAGQSTITLTTTLRTTGTAVTITATDGTLTGLASSTFNVVAWDTTPPSVTLGAPMSWAYLSGNTLFTRTGSDNVAVSWYTFIVYSWWTQIYSSWGNSSFTGINFDTWNGIYTWTVIVTDTAGNSTTGTNRWFTMDKTAPSVTLITPTSWVMLSWNTLFTRTGSDNVAVSWYVFKVYSWWTQIYSSWLTTTWINFTTWDGNYTWTVIVTDTAGNSTTGINRGFVIDATAPSVTLIAPTSWVYISWSTLFTRSGYDAQWISGYVFKVFDSTWTQIYSSWLIMTWINFDTWSGIYSWTVTVTDTVWNSTTATNKWFTMDKVSPIFAWVASWTTYTWNVTITFADANLSWAILSWLDNSYYSWNFQSWSIVSWTGRYIFTVYDKAWNSTWAIFTIDKTPPTASVAYVPTSWTITTGTVVATLTWFNKTGVTVTNNSWSTSYTFGWNGSFVFNLLDLEGLTGNVTGTVTWIRNRLSYSNTWRFENQVLNDGSISWNIIVTLWTWAFSGAVANYTTLTNVPAGLTWVFTLSGTNKLIITLSGNATSHAAANSTGNLIITFLTWAFSWYNPSDMVSSTQTWVRVTFYDPNPSWWLTPTDDTMIDADTNPGGVGNCADGKCQRMNYGAMTYICASDFWSKILFRFNLASLPTGSTITSAKLTLYRYQIAGATDDTGFTVKQIINNPSWIEGTQSAATALTGEPNYIQRQWQQTYRYNGSPGMEAWLDYATTNLISSAWFTGSNSGSYSQDFPFNSDGIALLQSRAGGAENQWLMMDEIPTTVEHRLCISSKEAATSGQRPRLSVTYYIDVTPPSLSSTDPANNTTGVAVNSNLFMNFSENVYATSGYNISIRKLVDWSLVEAINAANTGKILITNTQVRITPTTWFVSNTWYYIEVASGAFRDKAGNVYPGFTWSGTWKFTTVDNSLLPTITWAYFTWIFATTWIFGATITSSWGSAITERGFCWSTIQGFNDCAGTKVSETWASFATWVFTLPISWLPAGTQVYFKAIAVNVNGMAYTTETWFLTRPAKITVNSPTKVDNDSFLAHWNAVTWATTYNLYISTDSWFSTYVTWYAPLTWLTGTSYKAINLNATTTYYYKMSAVNLWWEWQTSDTTWVTTTYYPTPVAWLKFEETVWTVAYDFAEWSYHDGILFGNPTMNQTWVDGRAFCYDAVNDDVNIVNFNYGSRYTIGFRFETTSTGDNMHIFSHGWDTDSSSINVVLDHATQTLRTYVNGNQSLFILYSGVYNKLIDGNWHYYTISIDNNGAVPGKYNIVVYVDGLYQLIDSSLNTSTYLPVNNLVLGRVSNTTWLYYKWCIDDFRIFDQVLSTWEIAALYNQLSPTPIGSLSLSWPISFDFGIRDASEQIQTITKTFSWTNDYFQVIDTLWQNTGYYTTISISDMNNGSGDIVPYTAVAIKALTGIVTLSGTTNPRVYSAITWTYQYFTASPLTFIKRDTASNGGVTGTYGLQTVWKVDIPALQNIGNYTWVITYTLY